MISALLETLRARPKAALAVGIVLAASLSLALAGCGDDGETLVIAVQPTSTAAELTADAGEIEKFLEARLDVDVELQFPTTHAAVIEALRFGHADAAFMGAWPARLAADEADADVVLAEIRDVIIGDEVQEAPYYFSYWVVPPDSPYTSLEDLRSKRVAFPSQLSTSGYVAPMAKLVELGLLERTGGEVNPEDFFGEVFFAGGYAQAWEAVEAGQVDATVIAGDVPEELYREVLDNSRVLEEQGPIPSHAVVFSKDLKEPLRGKLIDALMELGSPQNRELMRKFISGIFVRFEETTTEEHLGALADYLGATGFVFADIGSAAPPGPNPDPEADPEPPRTTPEPPPAGAAEVEIGLGEWAISASPASVAAGEVYFLVTNRGADAHEFVVVRTDTAPDELPVVDGLVPEDEVDVPGEIEGIAPGSQASITLDLEPGNYVLICNLNEYEADEDEWESHYLLGMAAHFIVE